MASRPGELRRRCDLCRKRALHCARLHTEADQLRNRLTGLVVSLPVGSVLCMRCVDHNAHVCVRAHPLPFARSMVKCGRCAGAGKVELDHRTGHWRRVGRRAREVRCPECEGKGEVPG